MPLLHHLMHRRCHIVRWTCSLPVRCESVIWMSSSKSEIVLKIQWGQVSWKLSVALFICARNFILIWVARPSVPWLRYVHTIEACCALGVRCCLNGLFCLVSALYLSITMLRFYNCITFNFCLLFDHCLQINLQHKFIMNIGVLQK